MNQNPLVSVIMPVYNGGIYLKEAIESILNQTFTDFEFIILDDGSTDNSLKLIKHYANIDNRIIIISRENKGLVYTLNEGIEKSKGRYIARMDADDISLPKRFEMQLAQMEENNSDFCGCNFIIIDNFGNSLSSVITSTSPSLNIVILARSTPFAHGSVMIKKNFLDSHNLMYGQTKYNKAEDYALWIAAANNNAVIENVDEILFKYRDIDGTLSKNKINNFHAKRLSTLYIKKNKKKIFEIIIKNKKRLNNFEEDNFSYFLIRTFFSFSLKKTLNILKSLPMRMNIINLLRVLK